MIKENLNKENFWNIISEKFPTSFELFAKWIDVWKVEVGYDSIVKNNVKFHDLPFSMQNGIFHEFLKYTVDFDGLGIYRNLIADDITIWMGHINTVISNGNIPLYKTDTCKDIKIEYSTYMLGSMLRKIRTTRDFTLKEVFDNTKISTAYMSQLEGDKIKKPSAVVLMKLSKYYEVDIKEILSVIKID